MTKRVAILISGGGSNMVALVNSMRADHPARAVLVLSNQPDAGGLAKAAAAGVPTAVVAHKPFAGDRAAFEAQLHAQLLKAAPDVICLAGFMRILTPEFVAKWPGKMLNIHPSLLPKYKGLNTYARAIDAGDTQAGCTVHGVTAELDDGPILGQARVPVLVDDTPQSLAARVLEKEHILYPVALRRFIDGNCEPIKL
ncbi:MAG: phosphoribosylglycinamide formyltransferase [Marinosulfonomonas sp.]|nr:phosphoribosylglycinamide formyltransferase [Marinosulfonomonas sp.]